VLLFEKHSTVLKLEIEGMYVEGMWGKKSWNVEKTKECKRNRLRMKTGKRGAKFQNKMDVREECRILT
jgi:hypothetical protein